MGDGGHPVWAGRLDHDKCPEHFLDILQRTKITGTVYGTGPMEEQLRKSYPHADFGGWLSPAELWKTADLYVGTSRREAFGRSAVEAAHAGVPVVISDQYGAAEFLFTDPELSEICVLPLDRPELWDASVVRIMRDVELRRRISDHVYENATGLSIQASVKRVQERLLGITER
jgi:glycosyltransferase involved in cell wall biosynthesis